MKNVRIAIIDTGLIRDFAYPENVMGGRRFWIEGQHIYMDEQWEDVQGHGTMVAATIKKYCPECLLYILKIYDNSNRTSSVLLLQALEYLLNVDVQYVNISLAVDSITYRDEISAVMRQLTMQGKEIFASVKNGYEHSFPADDCNCYGVKSKVELSGMKFAEYESAPNGKGFFLCDGSLEQVQILKDTEKAFSGNSKATAKILGIIAEENRKLRV